MLLASCASATCERGKISYYGREFEGKRTANGERFHAQGLTAAHRTLPFGTDLDVTVGDRHVRVRVNDRGPFVHGRILDVSTHAADLLGFRHAGFTTARICWEKLSQ